MQSSSGLPLIPLSPTAQSYVICNNALTQACEKLNEARANPSTSVDIVRRIIENVKVEKHRLDTLNRKMQSVEAATALHWDPEMLARQIAIIDNQLFGSVIIDKRLLSQLDTRQTKLHYLMDFHSYLTHSFAHQLIYWAELMKGNVTDVVPPIHPKDSLITHFVRTAYLLLHAYRDFSGFAAIIRAISLPEVRRLKKLWQSCSTRTKDMYRDLAAIVSPSNNYQAYHACLRTKLEPYVHSKNAGMMIAIPWIQPILLSIHSIVTAYTAGDNENNAIGTDIVLSAPGAHKLDIELALLELCQQNSTVESSDFLLEEMQSRRQSQIKPIHLEGVRAAVIPIPNLNHLAPGDQLTHHWLVSRVYLRKDQLIDESIEVEPLKMGEKIAADEEELAFADIKTSLPTPVDIAQTVSDTHKDDSDDPDDVNPQDTPSVHKTEAEVEVESVAEVEEVESEVVIKDTSIETEVAEEEVDITESKEEERDYTEAVGSSSVAVQVDQSPSETHSVHKTSSSGSSTSSNKNKTKLSATAPEFIPHIKMQSESVSSEEKWCGYPIRDTDKDAESEKWNGYPIPSMKQDEDEEEVWKGYPGPTSNTGSPRRASSQSETSEEWKGYQATKMEADWQRESALKVKEHEWQGYVLETLNEDELDSSTMMDGEFQKSRQARGQQGKEILGSYSRGYRKRPAA